MAPFLQALENRRSIYALGRETTVTQEEMVTAIETAVKLSPSAFNSQTSRVVILFEKANQKLWDLTTQQLEKTMKANGASEEAVEATRQKIAGFAAGIGTALFFEDRDIVESLQQNFPLYADNFPFWSEQSTGIASVNAWVALSDLGLGGNLQHYNPLIDEAVKKEWNLLAQWKLRGQLVFGSILSEAKEKEFMDSEDRFRVIR